MAQAVLSSREDTGWSQIKDAPYGYVEVMHSDRPCLPLRMISYHEGPELLCRPFTGTLTINTEA